MILFVSFILIICYLLKLDETQFNSLFKGNPSLFSTLSRTPSNLERRWYCPLSHTQGVLKADRNVMENLCPHGGKKGSLTLSGQLKRLGYLLKK